MDWHDPGVVSPPLPDAPVSAGAGITAAPTASQVSSERITSAVPIGPIHDPGLLAALLATRDLLVDLAQHADPSLLDDAAKIDAITALEHMKGSLTALQARTEVAFRDGQVRAQRDAGVPRDKLGKGVADQIALARRITPKQASDQLSLRRVLVETMPRTTRLLASGEVGEWGAHQVAQACLILDDEDRDRVDAELEPVLPGLTATRAGGTARAIANSLDPEAAVRRTRTAILQRHVSLRPAPDSMCLLTALLPVQQGVACLAALDRHARTLRAGGDPRTAGQVMADALVERVTGLERADGVGIEVNLLMTDATLLGEGDDTAYIDGHAIPGRIARHLALGDDGPHHHGGADPADRRFLRRLFTDPATGSLTGIDERRRTFTGTLRRFITTRDQACRTPWCDSPIRHIDHAHRHAEGGPTDLSNGVGHCERFNQVKEMPGWHSVVEGGESGHQEFSYSQGQFPPGTLRIVTPTGHEYSSVPPQLRQPSTAASAGARAASPTVRVAPTTHRVPGLAPGDPADADPP